MPAVSEGLCRAVEAGVQRILRLKFPQARVAVRGLRLIARDRVDLSGAFPEASRMAYRFSGSASVARSLKGDGSSSKWSFRVVWDEALGIAEIALKRLREKPKATDR